jgi:beta-glucanase (GH16 family)
VRYLRPTTAIAIVIATAIALCFAPRGRAAAVFDNFNGPAGSAPNPAYWGYISGTGRDEGIQNYQTANAYLDGQSHLVIEARSTAGGYTSARVQTKNKLNLGYGTITARIKMPSGQGLWPAFWLVGADEDTTPWPDCGEIDMIELLSNSTTYDTTIHGPMPGAPRTGDGTVQAQFTGPIADLSTDYHDYWVQHFADHITVGIDTRTLGEFTPASLPAGAQWVYNRPMYAIFNLAVGGPWAGAPDSSTQFPAKMVVDWFRFDPA